MASVAQDKKGDIAVGVTVSNGIPVFPTSATAAASRPTS
jgi:hypothetical protein